MKKENIRTSSGEVILKFSNHEKDREVTICFDSVGAMFKEFHRVWKKAQEDRLFLYQILRYCVDNNFYSNEEQFKKDMWFIQERKVCDQREGSVINRDDIFGLKILFDQYIFEKEGK